MHPLSVPMMVKISSPVLTYSLLAITLLLIGYIVYLILVHRRLIREAKKRGDSPHTGHHGNH